MLKLSDNWKDYECLDAGNGEKLERWGNVILRRPDPQAMWKVNYTDTWKNPDGFYHRSNKGGGYWENINNVPNSWMIHYKELSFHIKQLPFLHPSIMHEKPSLSNLPHMQARNINIKLPITAFSFILLIS